MSNGVRAVAVGTMLVLIGASGPAHAATLGTPRLAFTRETDRPAALVIATSDADLKGQTALAGGGIRVRPLPYPQSGPAWSPDGSQIAFSAMFGGPGQDLKPQNRRLYLVGSDGTGLRPIPNTRGGFAPVLTPDGTAIAFARTVNRSIPRRGAFGPSVWRGTTVWTVNLDGTGLRRLTEWRNGVTDIPSSFSTDGKLLGVTHRDVFRDRDDAIAVRVPGGKTHLLAKDAAWPMYSPDGSRIAYLGIKRLPGTTCCELGDGFSVDLFVENADGTARQRLTATPAVAERAPSWDPSGERLAYTTKRSPTEATSGLLEDGVMEINADGTCRSKISAGEPGSIIQFPVWQPGPGREAGRIPC
jgi:Tol biopolymer transport system component